GPAQYHGSRRDQCSHRSRRPCCGYDDIRVRSARNAIVEIRFRDSGVVRTRHKMEYRMGEPEETGRGALPAIGRYRLLARLGAGGMADVFLAVMVGPRGFNKLVVLKVPRAEVADNPGVLAMFIDEARLAARLNHPNVVQTYEIVREDGRDVIVMEYL